jgi:hypothetical protein
MVDGSDFAIDFRHPKIKAKPPSRVKPLGEKYEGARRKL